MFVGQFQSQPLLNRTITLNLINPQILRSHPFTSDYTNPHWLQQGLLTETMDYLRGGIPDASESNDLLFSSTLSDRRALF